MFSKLMDCVGEAFRCYTGRDIKYETLWACEADEAKQSFIRAQFPLLPAMYEDAAHLANSMAHNLITNRKEAIPYVDWFVAGPTCTSRSPQSARSRANEGCVQRKEPATGETFDSVMSFISRARPRVVILERVTEDSEQSDASRGP